MKRYLLKSTLTATIVLLLICMNAATIQAQTKDSLLKVYNNETLQSFGNNYIKGSKQLKFGELKPEFKSFATKDLYKKSKGNLVLGRLLTVTALGSLVTAAIIKKDNKGAAAALSIAGIGLNLGSIHFRKKSSELIGRAIWQRNKEILFGVQ